MKIKNVYFLKSCTAFSQFPEYDYPEFAFMGRSNVGKSSLLNMILGQKGLVKTGARPGVTTTINFFIVNDNRSFVDLPGYGYAKLPVAMKKKFLPLIKSYLEKRRNLKAVFLLIDIRRTPGDFEMDMISLLAANRIPVAITLTKCDKLSNNQKNERVKEILEALEIDADAIFITSATTGKGKKDLLKLIEEYSLRNQS